MLLPEVIDRLIRERERLEEEQRPALELPLPPPDWHQPDEGAEEEEGHACRHVIVIDLA